jgi:hypothetical protein
MKWGNVKILGFDIGMQKVALLDRLFTQSGKPRG